MINQAVILAGGLGSRLGSLTQELPKPLLLVGGRPFLEYIILNLKRHAITHILLSVGYLAEKIIQHFGKGESLGVDIDYSIENEPAGTGGALCIAKEKLNSNFYVINGDTIFDIDYRDLSSQHMKNDALATMALRKATSGKQYGTVMLVEKKITDFYEKKVEGISLVNGGIYVMQSRSIDLIPSPQASLENDYFPVMAAQGLLEGKVYNDFFIDMGTPEKFYRADNLVKQWAMRKKL